MAPDNRIGLIEPDAQRSRAIAQVLSSRAGQTATVLCASDLSSRSGNPVRRAALLAQSFGARLLLLHVIDPAQPMREIRRKSARAQMILDARVRKLALTGGRARVVVRVGKPHQIIASLAAVRKVDLIVLGPYRSRLGDSFFGTAAERIVRRTSRPVLVVNTAPQGSYREVLLTAGKPDEFRKVLRLTEHLGLLTGANTSIVQAIEPVTRSRLSLAGATQGQVAEYVRYVRLSSAAELVCELEAVGLSAARFPTIQRVARPFRAIDDAAKASGSDLVVVGTSRFPALKRVLVGSVSNEVQRRIVRDVLVVPPGAASRCQSARSIRQRAGKSAYSQVTRRLRTLLVTGVASKPVCCESGCWS